MFGAGSGGGRMCQGRGKTSMKCHMTMVQNPLTEFYSIHSLYVCESCGKYHLCSGTSQCIPIVAKEGLICDITGKYIQSNVKETDTMVTNESVEKCTQVLESECTLHALYSDILEIINKLDDISEIRPDLVYGGELNPIIKQNIAATLSHCVSIIQGTSSGYSIVCSMYVHIIMSIYAKKTIYGHMLFKCTRNKKYDAIAKKIREKWMYIV